jgi:antitoxin CcdA
MRMTDRIEDPAGPFRPATAHSGHIGQGPKPGAKRAVNLSVDTELLGLAKALGINLSRTLEDALRRLTEAERTRRWQEENREALQSYDALIAHAGVFGEELLDLDDPTV